MKPILFFSLALALLLSACGAPPAESAAPSDTAVTFTDDLGRTVTVDSPQRAAPLLGSFAQIWLLAGGSVCATADDAWEDLDLPLAEDTVNLGPTKELSLEQLLAARPDFILASSNTRQNLEWRETLEATGIPTAYFEVNDFDDYLRMLALCTDLTGRKDLYEEHGTAVQGQIDAVLADSRARLDRDGAPTVLSIRASASSITVKNSENNVLGEMLHTLGCVNIADSDSSLLEELSIERILQADPDLIFFVQRGDDDEGTAANIRRMLEEDPAWSKLTAVRTGRVYYMDKNLYNLKPNHRWGEAYEKLEAMLANGY